MCNMFAVEMVNNITFIAQIKQMLDKLISLVKICQYLKNNICIYVYIKTKITLRLVVLFLCICYVFVMYLLDCGTFRPVWYFLLFFLLLY